MRGNLIHRGEIARRIEAPEFAAIRGGKRVNLAVGPSDEDGAGNRAARCGIRHPAARRRQTRRPKLLARRDLNGGDRARHQSHIEILPIRRAAPNKIGALRVPFFSEISVFQTTAPLRSGSSAKMMPLLLGASSRSRPPGSVFKIGDAPKSQSGPGLSGQFSVFSCQSSRRASRHSARPESASSSLPLSRSTARIESDVSGAGSVAESPVPK